MTTTEVENFPGFIDGVQGPDLMASMQAQAERFGARIVIDDATNLDLAEDTKVIATGRGDVYRSKAVILTMGSAYRKLGVADEDRLTGHGVSWCATCDGFFFREQHIPLNPPNSPFIQFNYPSVDPAGVRRRRRRARLGRRRTSARGVRPRP